MRSQILASAVAIMACAQVQAAPILFTGTDGTRSASAQFDVSGNNLIVTLTNTATYDLIQNDHVLTAVFFTTSVPLTLTRVSALLAPGSIVIRDTAPAGGVVGGEFAYVASGGKLTHGISSAGFGVFGPPDRFPGADLHPPASPNGVEYGITTDGDNPLTGNGTAGTEPLIDNSVVFTLSGLPNNFSLSSITGVRAQYGTALNEPKFNLVVPEPTALTALAVAGLAMARRRRA